MQAIIIGDLHFGIKSDIKFIDYQIDNLNEIIDYTLKSNIKNIIFLGDIFHTRQYVDISILHKVLDCFTRLENLNVYMLAGNHDIYFKTSNDINSLSTIFKKYSFTIIDKKPKEIIIDNEQCLFIPWINKNNADVCLNSIKQTSAKYCFGHLAINGFNLIRGVKEIRGLKQSLFKKFIKTFSGHFHLKDDQNNILYVGSFVQLDWNDFDDKKRIIEIDTKKEIFKDIFLTDNIFEKVFVTDKNINIDYYKNKILKIYIETKITPKDYSVIDNLKEDSLYCEVIDNSILLENNENLSIKNEDFLSMLDEIGEELIESEYRKAVKNYIKKLYDRTLKGE